MSPEAFKEMNQMASSLMELKLSGPGAMHCAAAWGDVHRCYNDPGRPTGPPVKALETFQGMGDTALDGYVTLLNSVKLMADEDLTGVMIGKLQAKIDMRVNQLHEQELVKREEYWRGWVGRISTSFRFAQLISNGLLEIDRRERVSS